MHTTRCLCICGQQFLLTDWYMHNVYGQMSLSLLTIFCWVECRSVIGYNASRDCHLNIKTETWHMKRRPSNVSFWYTMAYLEIRHINPNPWESGWKYVFGINPLLLVWDRYPVQQQVRNYYHKHRTHSYDGIFLPPPPTCQIIMSTCQIFLLACQIIMSICQIFSLTCPLV
jgi:hypothetical protein